MLPVELLVLIFDQSDPATLHSCSFLSKQLLPYVQRLLFHSVSLNFRVDLSIPRRLLSLKKFATLIRHSPHIGHYVHSLRLSRQLHSSAFIPFQQTDEQALILILDNTPHLTQLALSDFDWRLLSPRLKLRLYSTLHSYNLRSVKISAVHNIPTVFFRLLAHLKDLEISHITIDIPTPSRFRTPPPPVDSLKSLWSINVHCVDQLFLQSHPPLNAAHIRTLTWVYHDPPSHNAFHRLSQLCALSLQVIHFHAYTPHPEPLDLSPFSALHTCALLILLKEPPAQSHDISWICTALSTLRPTNPLAHIDIQLPIRHGASLHTPALSLLDACIANLPFASCSLRTVVITLRVTARNFDRVLEMEYFKETLEKGLPVLCKSAVFEKSPDSDS